MQIEEIAVTEIATETLVTSGARVLLTLLAKAGRYIYQTGDHWNPMLLVLKGFWWDEAAGCARADPLESVDWQVVYTPDLEAVDELIRLGFIAPLPELSEVLTLTRAALDWLETRQ